MQIRKGMSQKQLPNMFICILVLGGSRQEHNKNESKLTSVQINYIYIYKLFSNIQAY